MNPNDFPAATPSFIGQQIDQYLIQQRLGQGGMADVYLALDVNLQRPAAIKVILPELAQQPGFVARFQREAESVARLHHPHIVQIFAGGVTPDGRPYLAMEYVEGATLRRKLEERLRAGAPFPAVTALMLARQAAEALTVIHQAGIVHRDVKPDNILVRANGQAVLADLGVAALLSATTELTHTNVRIGTPAYFSPEQAAGWVVDGRSDIYALGLVLFELLTGELPGWPATPSLIERRPDLTAETCQVVNRCLQREPQNRYSSARALVSALDRVIVAEVARQQARGNLVWVWARQNWWLLALFLFVLLMLPLSVWAWWRAAPPEVVVPTPEEARAFAIAATSPAASDTTPTPPEPVVFPATPTLISPTTTPTPTETATSTPTETAAPSPTPFVIPQSVACPLGVYSPLQAAWTLVEDRLGCPAALPQVNMWIGQQDFQRGYSFWRRDEDKLYAVYNNGIWQRYDNMWREGDPVFSCGEEQNPPTPILGAGKMWCSFPEVQQGLGEAIAEAGGQEGVVQDFAGGFILRTGAGQTFIFFQDGSWQYAGQTAVTEVAAVYLPLPLSEIANAPLDFHNPPTGSVLLGGVPFSLSRTVFKSQASPPPHDAYPTSARLSLSVPGAERLFLLLNAGNGVARFEGMVIGQLYVTCAGARLLVSDLRLGVEIREWHGVGDVVHTAVLPRPVWQGSFGEGQTGHMDLVQFELPAACSRGALTEIELVDTSQTTVNSLDPALNLIGLTVQYRP